MELHQLRYFCAVARTGSFTRAAEEEGISQPSLSEAIRKLESDVGAPVFSRLGRTVRLTPQGERLLPYAQQMLQVLADARRSVHGSSDEIPTGKLVVGCIPTVMPYFLAPQLPQFAAAYPQVDLELVEDVTSRLVDRLQGGLIDVAVLALPLKHAALICSELFREPLYLAVPARHSLADQSAARLEDLGRDKLLVLKEGHCFREDAMSICRKAKVPLERRFESDNLTSILSLVSGGFGVGIVPAMAAHRPAPGVVLLPIIPEAQRRIGYSKLRKCYVSPAERAFTRWLRTHRTSDAGALLQPPMTLARA